MVKRLGENYRRISYMNFLWEFLMYRVILYGENSMIGRFIYVLKFFENKKFKFNKNKGDIQYFFVTDS